MSQLPLTIGRIHFTGIGGIGMSGIAEILHDMGYDVSGSDISENANVKRLRDKGITIKIGQVAENIDGVAIIVISTAIKQIIQKCLKPAAVSCPLSIGLKCSGN